jgi:hypothetical protein
MARVTRSIATTNEDRAIDRSPSFFRSGRAPEKGS